MREIKFRAWDKKAKEMIYLTGFKYFGRNGIQIFYNYEDDGIAARSLNEKDIEIMQYTGLKDKNGVEIYEGDIFKAIDGSLFKVSYDEEELIYIVNCIVEDYSWNISRFKIEEFEVIGNIYENPELLNKEEQA